MHLLILLASSLDIPSFISSPSKAFLAFLAFQPIVSQPDARVANSLEIWYVLLNTIRTVFTFPVTGHPRKMREEYDLPFTPLPRGILQGVSAATGPGSLPSGSSPAG